MQQAAMSEIVEVETTVDAPVHAMNRVAPSGTTPVQSNGETIRQRVLRLAWPVIGENLLETLLFVVDTLLVARLGAAAIAGVGSAMQILFFLVAALSALSVGSSVLVAQAFGAGNTARAATLARQSLIWSVLLSVPLACGGLIFSVPIIGSLGWRRRSRGSPWPICT